MHDRSSITHTQRQPSLTWFSWNQLLLNLHSHVLMQWARFGHPDCSSYPPLCNCCNLAHPYLHVPRGTSCLNLTNARLEVPLKDHPTRPLLGTIEATDGTTETWQVFIQFMCPYTQGAHWWHFTPRPPAGNIIIIRHFVTLKVSLIRVSTGIKPQWSLLTRPCKFNKKTNVLEHYT